MLAVPRPGDVIVNLGYALAALAGLFIALQVSIMGRNAPAAGPFTVALLIHVAGLVAAVAVMVARRDWTQTIQAAAGWWWVVPGVAGFLILSSLSLASARVGVAVALSLSIGTQLVAGLLFDARNDVAPLDLGSIAGVVLLAAGSYLVASRTPA
jgi:uncharacterized membrane protein YdcZ (DUF606 family)